MRYLRYVLLGLLALGALVAQAQNTPPAQAVAPLDASAGLEYSCVVTPLGGVNCWGFNDRGQLGDGTTTNRTTVVGVSGLGSGVVGVTAGTHHTCAVTISGGLKCWGYNFYGQLGDGTTTNRLTPVDVSGLGSGVAAAAAGERHTCVVTTAGGVKCWGNNQFGKLGDGTTTDRTTPVAVFGLTSGVAAVAAGAHHTCALTTAGGVKCWGLNFHGQLGDGTTTDRTTPVDVSGLASGVVGITAAHFHSCALTTAEGVKCWGRNLAGALGDGTTTNRTTPVDVLSGPGGPPLSGVGSVEGGVNNEYTCALTTSGGVKCWGFNQRGQLGDGTTTSRTTPVDVLSEPGGLPLGGVGLVATGFDHNCAVMTAGGLKCWGHNSFGELGDGTTTTPRTTPVDALDSDSDGVADALDNCPDNPDCDGDFISDGPDDPDAGGSIVAGPDNCPNDYNPTQTNTDLLLAGGGATIGGVAIVGDALGDACDDDDDDDGFIDTREDYLGTDPLDNCGVNAWPPDTSDNATVNAGDFGLILTSWQLVDGVDGGYIRRADLSGNGTVNAGDFGSILAFWQLSCT